MSATLQFDPGLLESQGESHTRTRTAPAVYQFRPPVKPRVFLFESPCDYEYPLSNPYAEHGPLSWLGFFDMSQRLRHHLFETYSQGDYRYKKIKKDFAIQIDDQDDHDMLSEFCNIWIKVLNRNVLEIELNGALPITPEIADLAEIYHGKADATRRRVKLQITPAQIEVLNDLANLIRKTAFMGNSVNNPNWFKISARTISSLYRFVRVIKEYMQQRRSNLSD